MAKMMVFMAAVVMLLTNGIAAEELFVGDDYKWNFPPSSDFYSNWAAAQNFTVGDVLVFDFDKGFHTVASVTSKAAYDACSTTLDMNSEVDEEGPSARTLTSSGQFYFFCTKNLGLHCRSGMKFTANVAGS